MKRIIPLKPWCRLGLQFFAVIAINLISLTAVKAQSSPDDFITTWRTTTDDETLTFPGGEGFEYTIDWGDGTMDTNVNNETRAHPYAVAGDYTITVSNTITRFRVGASGAIPDKLISVDQWGTARWANMQSAFQGAANMNITATDQPNLSSVTDMRLMFRNATAFNSDISGWDVRNITSMARMFDSTSFNQNLGAWYIADETPNSSYNGTTDLVVLTFTAQNTFLRGQNPSYSLPAGMVDNDRFTISSSGGSGTLSAMPGTPDGSYSVQITANGSLFGSNNSRTLAVTVAGGTPPSSIPVITLTGPATVNLVLGSTYTEQGATATDDVDDNVVITGRIVIGGDTVDTSMVGTYTITYNVSDSATTPNAAVEVTREVIVSAAPDTTIPVITLTGPATVNLVLGSTYTEQGATATDDVDDNVVITGRIVIGGDSVDTTTAGTYTITYNVSDSATTPNAAVEVTREVIVSAAPDTTIPVITLTGPATVNLLLGSTYTDAGATATDNVDDNVVITGRIVIGGDSVDVNTRGTYTITYNVSDSATTPNAAVEVTRTVTVAARPGTVPPLTAVAGDQTVTLSWTAPDDGGSDLLAYGLRVSLTAGGGTFTPPQPSGDATTITISTLRLMNGTQYTFSIFARNAVGDSLSETTVTATPFVATVPAAITDLAAVANSDGTVALSWTTPANGGSDITDYSLVITRPDGTMFPSATQQPSVNAAITANMHTVRGLMPGTLYTFHLGAGNTVGPGPTVTDTATPGTVPGPVTNLKIVNNGDRQVTLSWDALADNGGLPFTYEVSTVQLGGGLTIGPSMLPSTDPTMHTVRGLTNGDLYEFYIRAVNTLGESAYRLLEVAPRADTTIPVITLTGPATVNLVLGSTYTEQGATATDDVDDNVVITGRIVIGGDSVDTSMVGTYTITYNVSDSATTPNAAVEVTRTVTVSAAPDTTIPVITLNGLDTVNLVLGSTYTEQGAMATDNVDGDISANIVIGGDSVDTSMVGTYTITYNVSDSATTPNAAVEVTREVIVSAAPDTTIPVITLTGPATVNLVLGSTYTEQGATATDNVDDNVVITGRIVIGGDSVDTTTAGTYTITYNVSDSATTPNAAVEVTREVIVSAAPDTTIPVITLTGPATVNLVLGSTYTEQGATATDDVDDNVVITGRIVIGGDTVDTSMVGTYTITYNVSDSATTPNAAVEVTREVIVSAAPDTTIPVITLTGGTATVNLVLGSTYTEQGATATDNVDDNVVITGRIVIGGDTVDTSMVGTYTITYNVSDSATTPNAAVEVTREVIVSAAPDTTIPVITLNGLDTVNLVLGSTYTEQGATATDDVDDNVVITGRIVIGGDSVDTTTAGTYTITYNVSDSATTPNAAVEVTREVIVSAAPDTTIPVITLNGLDTVNLVLGSTYTEQGATASDNIDGDISANIVIGGDTVDTTTAGTYTITYNVSDSATTPNAAVEVTREVIVSAAPDTTIPVITLNGLDTVNLVLGSTYTEQGATATDDVDDNVVITGRIVIGGDTVDTSMVGTYTITYNVSDSATTPNAAVEVTREVIVSAAPDTTIPVITLNGLDTVNLVLGSTYTEQGATATDNVDDNVVITGRIVIGGDSVDTSMAGTYTITYNVSDSATTPNAAVEVTREVIVSAAPDTTIPVITLTGPDTVNLVLGSTYTELNATASDNIDGDISANIVIGGDSVDTTTAGTYTITYNVSDSATTPNAAVEVTREVIVSAAPDTTIPVITLTGPDTVNLVLGSTYTEQGAMAADNVDDDVVITGRIVIGGDTVDTSMVGTYTITYNVSDSATTPNAAVEVTREVIVSAAPDTTIPVITLTGPDTVNLVLGSTYTEQGATATDDVDDNVVITGRIVIGGDSVDTSMVGTYTITYNVSDSATTPNAAVEVTREVIVSAAPDTTIPVITLTGTATVNLVLGSTYTEQGATAADDVDDNVVITGRIVIGGDSVDTTTAGTYTITYNVSDSATTPNAAVEVTREVIVSAAPDTTIPVITLTGPDTVNLVLGSTYTEQGAMATDNVDDNVVITGRIVIGGDSVDTTTAGTYTITYNVSDSATTPNAAVEVTREVIVSADTTIPVITLTGPDTVNLVLGSTYTEQGAMAADNVDDDVVITGRIVIGGDTVDTSMVGTYTITYNVSDSATTPNAAVEVTREVIVSAAPDTTIPVITLTGPDTVNLVLGSTYTEQGAMAADNVDDDVVITGRIVIGGDSVDTTTVGIYRLTYNVSDSDGNAAVEVTRVVTVASATPRANAGADQSVAPGVNVTLSGSGTDVKDDAAGTPLSYAWTLTSGTPAPSLSNAATASASFTAATVTSTVTYVFTLTVTDSDGNPASDTVTITVNSEVAITRDIDKQNKLVLPSVARAMAYQNVNAISTRISQAGEANLKNSVGGKSNLVDILKSMERLNTDSSLTAEEALANSRFALALDGIEGAFWGKIDYQKFKGSDQGIKYDGDLFSSTVGVEGQINERTRLGLALSRNKSDIDYTDSAPVLAATSAGDYEIVMFSVNPYIAWKWTDRVDLWATFGYGQGELELTLANSGRVRSSDISQKTLAVGGSGLLLDRGAIALYLKGEALKTRFEVDKSEGIAALELDAERLRLGLEGTHGLSLEDGASLNSSVEVGVRYDGGDGQTGSSGEIGGGLEYSNGRGLSLQGNARVLVGGDNYDEWGLGGLLKFQPSTDGRGVSFNLGLGHGNTASKTQDIWKHTLANNSTATDNYTTTDINLGYGMTAPHWLGGSAYGILTPYTEVRLGNSNSYGLGLNWKLDPSVGLKLNFKHQSDSADSVNLEGEIHF